MKKRIIAAIVLLPLFFTVLFVFPPLILAILISVISAIAAYELMKAIAPPESPKRIAAYAFITAALTPLAVYFSNLFTAMYTALITISAEAQVETSMRIYDQYRLQFFLTSMLYIFFILITLLLIDFFLTFKSPKRAKLRQILVVPIAAIVIPLMLSSLIGLRMMPQGLLLVLLPIIVSIFTDSGAYFTGVLIGKRKAFPTISPNKTVEGYIGGIVCGIAAMLIYGLILDLTTQLTISYAILVIYGIIGAVVTATGDLAFSWIKRKCGIKDYGNLIPGHGGMLDRFDSMIFSAPTMLLLVTIIPCL